jgi:hypothetical protein
LQNSGASRRGIARTCVSIDVIARSKATKQSSFLRRGEMDCFAYARNDSCLKIEISKCVHHVVPDKRANGSARSAAR